MAEDPKVQPISTLDPKGKFQVRSRVIRIRFHMTKDINFRENISPIYSLHCLFFLSPVYRVRNSKRSPRALYLGSGIAIRSVRALMGLGLESDNRATTTL